MESLQSRFDFFIRKQGLASSGDKVLLAVSGGKDSMAMVRLFKDSGILFGIGHVNHSLRGEESDGDARAVRELAKKMKVPFHELKADTKGYCKNHQLTLQEGARDLRYKWLENTAEQNGYASIATAHHLDDSIESFFINLIRGTGIHGLTGIPIRNRRIIRPLTFASREEIAAFVKTKRIAFREDSSNRKDDYLRNRIRHHVIPLFEKLQPAFTEVMKGNIERLRLTRSLHDERLNELSKKMVRKSDQVKTISIDEVLDHPQPVQLLHALLHLEGFAAHEPEKLLVAGRPGKLFRDAGQEVIRDRRQLILKKVRSAPDEIGHLEPGIRHIRLQNGELFIGRQRYRPGTEKNLAKDRLMMDAEKVSYPVEIRKWRPGDRFKPLGMKNHKKVSDFLTDLKLSVADKEQTMVAVSEGRIICILGHRIDDQVKVTDTTRNVLLFRWLS